MLPAFLIGNTIPLLLDTAKKATGELDETVLRSIAEKLGYYRSLEQRKQRSCGSSTNRASS